MGKPEVPPKPREDRVREAVEILTKLKSLGITPTDPGYSTVKSAFDTWIADGRSFSTTVEFPRHGRCGELTLPRKSNVAASLSLKSTL
jgi:hypothetical protein